MPLFLISLLVSLPACKHGDGLNRVEVRGKVIFQGAPVSRGLITFRPTSGSKGPAAGTGIIDGEFTIPVEKGPIVGPHEVEVKIVNASTDPVNSKDSTLTKREFGQLKTFSQQVEVKSGVNEFEFSFPLKPPTAEQSGPQ